ncbi:hypothetical protein CAPTEDRAFT_217736 [Capitella teleta]|uniref:Uncharacterized protein n=1 Tax=Capitella teleta TaxID=283909 RepID=X2AML5_CAPTE|nr:hypothetical protein CAPTEDRAFT_217736 [Capitella teleta]|eukprot:ELU00347.1 hypothetical protein CAPTEDRAFT_217736 [Capitella teleta]
MYPSVQDFQQHYKLLLLRACISNSVLSNCEDDSAAVLLNVLNIAPCPEDPPVRSDESVEALDPKEAQGNVLPYIAGYVAYRFLRAHSCSQCEAALLGAAEDHVSDSMVLMAAKAYRCNAFNALATHSELTDREETPRRACCRYSYVILGYETISREVDSRARVTRFEGERPPTLSSITPHIDILIDEQQHLTFSG